MKLALPAEWGERRRFETAEVRGFLYGEIEDAWLARLPEWLENSRIRGGEDLRAGRVFRFGDVVAKFFREKRRLRKYVRAPGAIRAAERYFELLPIRSPRPLLAVEGTGRLRDTPSLLVSEFVRGPLLSEAWHVDESARADLPRFLAEMHRRNVFHGDLHPMNLIRQGKTWVLLDLTALRNGLHRLVGRQRLILGQWMRLVVYLKDPGRLEQAFRAYHAEGLLRGTPERSWRQVLERAEAFANRPRGHAGAGSKKADTQASSLS